VAHGHGGRISVAPTLEVPGHPGVFAVGDVAEVTDPETGAIVPATAQAALAEAPVAAENILRRRDGRELLPFRYREKGAIVSVGRGRAAARWKRVELWGGAAGLLKSFLDREYRRASGSGR
jgi:NADH dehydrogenase